MKRATGSDPRSRFVLAGALSFLLALVAATTSESARAADACISDDAKGHLNSCANAGVQYDVKAVGKTPGVHFHTQAETEKKLKENKVGVPTVNVTAQRDDRSIRLAQRQLGLLITVIQQSEELLKSKPARAANRVIILRRLAEDYVELESAAFREKTQAEVARDGFKRARNMSAANEQQGIVDSRTRVMNDARRAAIGFYTQVATEYGGAPSKLFPSSPPAAYAQLDEVLYYLAYEYEQSQNYDSARKVYFDLIAKVPTSKYIPNAYLAFGELFFNQAQTDPDKWQYAQSSYEKVIKKPPPDNKVFGYAWYKLAYVFWNTGDFQHSLQAFGTVIDYGTKWSQIPNASKLAESARRDMIPVYAQTGDPGAAYTYFKPLSGDSGGSDEKTFKMMDDLGLNYLDTGHYIETIQLYKDLINRDNGGDKTCTYQSRITEAAMAYASGKKDTIVKYLSEQKDRYDTYQKETHSAAAKFECANHTAELIVETAMAWHLEAVGSSDKQRGTMNKETLKAASTLYHIAADTWTADQFSKFQFRKLIRADWPTLFRIKYNMADIEYFNDDWKHCGPDFQSVVKEDPKAPEATEAAYASVLCYENVYLDEHKNVDVKKGSGNLPGVGKDIKKDDEAKYAIKDLTPAQTGMLSAFDSFVCYIHPTPNDAEGNKRLVQVKYDRARTYFESQHWEEAALAFRDIAFNHPTSEYGVYAAALYLESVNVLTWHGPKRATCIDDMIVDVPKIITQFCTGDKFAANEDTCTNLTKVQCDIQRLHAQKLVDKANATPPPPDALQIYQAAGKEYFDLWTKYGATPISQKQKPQCEKLDEIVYNAASAFQAGRLIAMAISARKELLKPDNLFDPNSDMVKDALFQIAGNYQAIAVYDQSADFYEKYAKAYKDRKHADSALSDAIRLRLGLGNEAQAIDDATTYRNNYGTKHPDQTAAIQYAVGAHYAEKEDWDNVKSALNGSMSMIDRSAGPDIQLQAHAALARAYMKASLDKSGRPTDARYKAEYAKVRTIWDPSNSGNGGDAVVAGITKAYPDEDDGQHLRRVGRSLDAVGEAIFIAAEDQKAATVDVLPMPVYSGNGQDADVIDFIKNKVKPWLTSKYAAIAKVDSDYYQHVTDLRPKPPPRWVIAAASRSGLMWGSFVDEFRASPIPLTLKNDDELRGTYYQHLDEQSQPLKDNKAKPALVACLSKSVQFQYFDQFSRNCEAWLSKNYKDEYHIVDELRGAPTLSNSGLDDRPPPLIIGGNLWHAAATGPATEKAGDATTDKQQK